MDHLETLCRDISADWACTDDIILSTNLHIEYIEAQGVSYFVEWKEHICAAVGKIKLAEISVTNIQQELIERTNLSTKHDDKFGDDLQQFF